MADSGFRREITGLNEPQTPGGDDTGVDSGSRHHLVSLLGGPGHLGSLLAAGVEAGAVVFAAVLTTHLYRRAFLVLTLLLSAALSLAVICVLQLVKGETSR